jgi:hypothetical protein
MPFSLRAGEKPMQRLLIYLVVCATLFPATISNAQTFHDFKLGNHTIEGTTILFDFPDERISSLYAFNFTAYSALNEKTNRARMRLYDKDRNMLAEGKSICVEAGSGASFGSIVFSTINRDNVQDVVFFTLNAIPCEEGNNKISADENPELRQLSAAVEEIAGVLLPCLQSGKSDTECICANKDQLMKPLEEAVSFLQNHPALRKKELTFYQSEKHSNGGSESMELSLPLEEIYHFHEELSKCE